MKSDVNNISNENRHWWVFVVLLSVLYLVVRLPKLLLLPPFVDEIAYLRWTQLFANDLHYAFASFAASGKQPLYCWLSAVGIGFFDDPLWATRLVSVFAGLAALWGVLLLARRFFGEEYPQGVWVAGLLYLLCPFMVFHDRLGIYEPMVNAINVFALLLSLRLARKMDWPSAVWLGLLLGVGLITKVMTGAMFMGYPVVVLLDRFWAQQKGPPKALLLKLGVAYGISVLIYTAVNAYPKTLYQYTGSISFSWFLSFQGDRIIGQIAENASRIGEIYYSYLTLPVLALFAGFSVLIVPSRKFGSVSILLACLPLILFQLVFAKYIFARYLITTVPFLILGATWFLFAVSRRINQKNILRWGVFVFVAGTCALNLLIDYPIVFSPEKAPLDSEDHWQHITGWPSGYGLREATAYVEDLAKEGPFDLFVTRNNLAIPFNGFQIYLGENPDVRLHLCIWDQDKPLLFFISEGVVISNYANNYSQEREELHPENFQRVYFAGNVPHYNLSRFLTLNGKPEKVANFFRPGKKSAFFVAGIPLPKTATP